MEIGRVYLIRDLDIHGNGNKFGICVCVADRWVFLVNTENREMYDCIPFPKKEYDFPRHDSHIGCANIFSPTPEQIIAAERLIDIDEAQALLAKVSSSKTLIPKQIAQISADLQIFIDSRKPKSE
jgi:hypothetical protein